MTTGWTARDRIPVGTRFSARPDRPWGPPSLLYNGYRVFTGGTGGRGVGLTHTPHLVPKVLEKSRAIPLLTLRSAWPIKSVKPTYTISYIFLNMLMFTLQAACCFHVSTVLVKLNILIVEVSRSHSDTPR